MSECAFVEHQADHPDWVRLQCSCALKIAGLLHKGCPDGPKTRTLLSALRSQHIQEQA